MCEENQLLYSVILCKYCASSKMFLVGTTFDLLGFVFLIRIFLLFFYFLLRKKNWCRFSVSVYFLGEIYFVFSATYICS